MSPTGYATETSFCVTDSSGLSRYGLIRKIQDSRVSPNVSVSASSSRPRSRPGSRVRVKINSPPASSGYIVRYSTSAGPGNGFPSPSSSAIVLYVASPAVNSTTAMASSTQGSRRLGRLRTSPVTTAAELLSPTAPQVTTCQPGSV